DIIKKIERARVKMEQIKPRSTLPRGKKEGGLTVKLFKGHYTRRTTFNWYWHPRRPRSLSPAGFQQPPDSGRDGSRPPHRSHRDWRASTWVSCKR
ncbi:MAG: hypothetical protein ACREYE_19780, partial [Gammaproteobacteria bacterium]